MEWTRKIVTMMMLRWLPLSDLHRGGSVPLWIQINDEKQTAINAKIANVFTWTIQAKRTSRDAVRVFVSIRFAGRFSNG